MHSAKAATVKALELMQSVYGSKQGPLRCSELVSERSNYSQVFAPEKLKTSSLVIPG